MRGRREPSPERIAGWMSTVTLRLAGEADAALLADLAALDSRAPLRGPVLIAERDGRAGAARSLSSGESVADPFVASAALLALLELHAGRELLAGVGDERLPAPLRAAPAAAP